MAEPTDEPKFDKRSHAEIELEFPITIDGEKIAKLTMRRPKVSDRLWAEKLGGGDMEKVVKVSARLCDVAPEVIAELDDVDMAKVDKQYGAFRGDATS